MWPEELLLHAQVLRRAGPHAFAGRVLPRRPRMKAWGAVRAQVITDCAKLRMQDGEPLEAVITCGVSHANVVSVMANSWHSWRRSRSGSLTPQARSAPACPICR